MLFSYIRHGLTHTGASGIFDISRQAFCVSTFGAAHDCCPTAFALAKRLVDTNVRALTDSDLASADVTLVSGMLVQKENLLVILARCRARGLRTVVGGPIASGFGELHRYADHVVIGEAEELIAPLAKDLERGTAKPQYKASKMPSLDRSPVPDLAMIKTRHYSSMATHRKAHQISALDPLASRLVPPLPMLILFTFRPRPLREDAFLSHPAVFQRVTLNQQIQCG